MLAMLHAPVIKLQQIAMDNTYIQKQIESAMDNMNMRKHLYQQKEELLIELRKRGIHNKDILRAIAEVPREAFLPERLKSYAYENMALSIGYEQTISSPYIVAYMLQEAKLNKDSRVLEIGTGFGYQTAVLSWLCNKIYSIEIIPKLATSAEELLRGLGYYTKSNIEIEIGSGYITNYEKNFFDAIIVTSAPIAVPKHLREILKVNGRLIIPVENRLYQQKLLKVTKRDDQEFADEVLCDVGFRPMVR
jgi:protein-L-isoaspartate(D-aspartate) O-methyltransferase